MNLTAKLNQRIMPIDRGEIYEDPLDELLQKNNLGSVVGSGTMMNAENEIEYCDIEIELNEENPTLVGKIGKILEMFGAPKGSRLILESGEEIPIGEKEGIAVYLNGTDLPANVYQECDVNHVYEEFNRLLGDEGMIFSTFEGERETALNIYGNSFNKMQSLLQPFLDQYPLCQQARVVQIA